MNEAYMLSLEYQLKAMRERTESALEALRLASGTVRRSILIARIRELQGAIDRLQDEIEGFNDIDGLVASGFNAETFSLTIQ